ncbi:hypothetical protein EJ05DRAFT_542115 [Pseudovirgaria hyperparasitica]|uniref:Cora-domain-containing protein n=1 Tax=Pseudovirgaria hyperparasitica TaxID=470096 RepID=A0A6A6VTP2_9PEZI|nr:uncharacterized protein EJ05DRAFT_542115 [Pseudovirgaria hyperparasitica]KAF2753094.1 hypothetical protein EJ05DRAFT_542115 [Pseudovirgaria hyperparasitica]
MANKAYDIDAVSIRTSNHGSFQNELDQLSQRCSQSHAYPRPDLEGLSSHLRSTNFGRHGSDAYVPGDVEADIRDSIAVVHDLVTGNQTCFDPTTKGLNEFTALEQDGTSLVFIRGHASSQWLRIIAEKYKILPELFRRHLQGRAFNLEPRNLYSFPSLPSTSSRIIQLTISTICSRGINPYSAEPEDLEAAREIEAEGLTRYFQKLRSEAKVADSIIRNCYLVSEQEYVLEQTISIEINQSHTSWRAVVWLDSGRDLSKCTNGPWCPRPGSRPWETYFYPVIVHQDVEHATNVRHENFSAPSMTTLPRTNTFRKPIAKPNEPNDEWRAAQNICMIPIQYGYGLDLEVARKDALYALSELFQFAAASESQCLNLLQSRIEHELSFIGQEGLGRYNASSLLNLRYIKTVLTSHIQRLAQILRTLENRKNMNWPCSHSPVAEKSGTRLFIDLNYLLSCAQNLSLECERGIGTLADSSILEESRRTLTQAERVRKLTVLATIFIPLTFTCSIFGMNFVELGTGDLHIWIYFATTVPVIGMSIFMYNFDNIKRLLRF